MMSDAKWLLMVDWDGDGEFAGDEADVTGAALGLSLRHMRDLASGHMDAARLELRLRNDDHKYSPPNVASPLFGKLKPGRKVWLRAAFPYDEFDGEVDTSLAEHTPYSTSAYRWMAQQGEFAIATGGGVRTSGNSQGRRIATMDLADADVSFGCHFTRGSGGTHHGGLAFRCADANNYLYVRFTGEAVEAHKVEAGVDALLATAALPWDAGKQQFVQMTLHGDAIGVFVNQRLVLETQSAFNKTSTQHGIYSDGDAEHRWYGFGGWVSLFYGSIDAIDPHPQAGAQHCIVRASDEMDRLTSVTLYMYAGSSLPQTSDEIMHDILNYAGVDAAFRRLDAGMTLVPSLWSPPMWGVQAIDELHRLQDEEDGFIYVDGHGCWRLENRNHRRSAAHATPTATLRSHNNGTAPYFSELEWSDGSANIENSIFLRIRDAVNHGYQTVWTLGETPHFEAEEVREFLAESKDYDVVGGQLTPVPVLDYRANTQADGSGTDLTLSVSVTHPSTALYSGKGTLIRVQFGDTAGYLTLLGLRTFNALIFNAPLLVMADDAESKSAYGQRIRSIDARWTREVGTAQDTAAHRLKRRKSPRTELRVVMKNGSDANMMLMLQARLSDRAAVRYPDMGVSGDFWVEGHRLDVRNGWSLVERTLLLQAV